MWGTHSVGRQCWHWIYPASSRWCLSAYHRDCRTCSWYLVTVRRWHRQDGRNVKLTFTSLVSWRSWSGVQARFFTSSCTQILLFCWLPSSVAPLCSGTYTSVLGAARTREDGTQRALIQYAMIHCAQRPHECGSTLQRQSHQECQRVSRHKQASQE